MANREILLMRSETINELTPEAKDVLEFVSGADASNFIRKICESSRTNDTNVWIKTFPRTILHSNFGGASTLNGLSLESLRQLAPLSMVKIGCCISIILLMLQNPSADRFDFELNKKYNRLIIDGHAKASDKSFLRLLLSTDAAKLDPMSFVHAVITFDSITDHPEDWDHIKLYLFVFNTVSSFLIEGFNGLNNDGFPIFSLESYTTMRWNMSTLNKSVDIRIQEVPSRGDNEVITIQEESQDADHFVNCESDYICSHGTSLAFLVNSLQDSKTFV
jgi:hypothetical protein